MRCFAISGIMTFTLPLRLICAQIRPPCDVRVMGDALVMGDTAGIEEDHMAAAGKVTLCGAAFARVVFVMKHCIA